MPAALRYTVSLISMLMLSHATYSGIAPMFDSHRGTVVVAVVPKECKIARQRETLCVAKF